MSKKKVTIGEFNNEFFGGWIKIKKIIPHFIEWTTNIDDENDQTNSWKEINRIDIEFENGSKISIIPKSNREDLEEDEEKPLCLALDIVQFKPERINWRIEK